MNIGEFVIGQIALLAWREGKRLSPGSRPAMLGIAHIVRNRVESGWLQGDWLKIIEEMPIHAAEEITATDLRSMPDVYDKDFIWLYAQVGMVYDRTLEDQITSGADSNWASHQASGMRTMKRKGLFYCNLQLPIREWFKDKILHSPEHPRQAEAGTVTFFG